MSDDTTIDGVDDTTDTEIKPEPKTYTEAEMAGIIAQRDSLMDEKKGALRKAEAIRLQAEQEAAKKSANMEEFEKSLRGEFAEKETGLTAKLEAANNRIASESKSALLSRFSGKFNEPEGVDLVSHLVSTSFDGENVKTEFKDFTGKVITHDPVEYIKWMGKHPVLSQHMKADAANGGGAPGSKQVNGGAMNGRNEAAETAKSKGDAIGTLNERLKGQFKL
jgi:hypothetical protein